MKLLGVLFKLFLLSALVLVIVSFFYHKSLPTKDQILIEIEQSPIQKPVGKNPIIIEKEGFTAEISPLYNYELYGLVVTQYNTESWYDYYHKRDPFNTKDLCVVWGSNITTGAYMTGKYRSGEFTCYWNFNTESDYQNFLENEIANNHLIPENDELANVIKRAKIGDQIHFKGYLANYRIADSDGKMIGERKSSTTREDTGNNSCEVVYVTEFEIIKENLNIFTLLYEYYWYILMSVVVLVILSLLI